MDHLLPVPKIILKDPSSGLMAAPVIKLKISEVSASSETSESSENYGKLNGIGLGLCCLNTELRKQGIFCSRKPILKTIEERGISYLIEKARENCRDLIKMIEWNHQNGIRVFRISSELFPHYNNPKVSVDSGISIDSKLCEIPENLIGRVNYSLDNFREELQEAGHLAKKYGQRLTFHPGHFNVLATPDLDKLEKTIIDLEMHSDILDMMGMGPDSVMVIHGGGVYNEKLRTLDRWAERYLELPEKIRRRLVLENCETKFSITDCLYVSSKCGVPVVLDNFHFYCYERLHPKETFQDIREYIGPVLETWKPFHNGKQWRDYLIKIKPKFHISEQAVGGRVGKHSEMISRIPDYYLEIPEKYGCEIDIMIEAKLKEQAVFKLYKLHKSSGES